MKVKDIIQFTEWLPNPRMPAETPIFSILMPTYRRFASGHLTRAIQSVLDQSYRQFELLIIDDGSVDGSFDEIKRLMTLDARIHCLHHPRNVGLPALGCYEAFLKARGEYLMFCFDDTTYQENALEMTARYILENKTKIAFGYINYQFQDSSGHTSQAYWGKNEISQAHLIMTNFLPNLGAILHRDVPYEIGFLDPHLAIARLTDWDYWKRAARVYKLQYSGIHIGTELGLITENSLGLTYPVNQWVAYEWTERARDTALIPGAYEEYDVQSIPEDLSEQSRLVLRDLSRFYENKFWYKAQQILLRSDATQPDYLDSNTRILVLSLDQDLSVTLTFEYTPANRNRIRYVSPLYSDPRELVNASALIISRDLFHPEMYPWLRMARQLGIPHYYFFDEPNLASKKKTTGSKSYTVENLRKELSSFQGVLASNQALADLLAENSIHSSIHVFPPVMPSDRWLDHSRFPAKPAGITRIGFISNPHGHNEFIELVLPAIARLSKDFAVELVVCGDHQISVHGYPQLKIYQFRPDSSYRVILGTLQSTAIDILVHVGRVTRNSPYETQSVLLNAWVMKAVPILANQPPYTHVENSGIGLSCNDASEWFEKLRLALSDSVLVARVKENLHRYVIENYSGRQNIEVLKAISKECPAPGIAMIEHRFRIYLDTATTDIPVLSNLNPRLVRWISRLEALLRRNRSWLLPPHSPQERFVRSIYRNFRSVLRNQKSQ